MRPTLTRFAVGLLVAVLAVRPAGSQEPPASNRDVVLPVTTEVVRLDVVVTEKGGRPKGDLTRGDFVVLEDGQPQPIVQFEAFATVPVATPSEPAPTQEAAPETPKPPPSPPPRRYVVLVVDDLHIEASNLLRMKKTVDRFLEREIGPEDQLALVTTSGTGGLSQEFTSDRQALRRSVARLTIQDRTFKATRAPYMTEYQAELIERGDGEALSIAVQEILDERGRSPSAEAEARDVARMVLADSLNHARTTLETLDGVVRSLSDLKARKVVVLVTDGFLAGLTISASGAYDIRRVTDACTRAGVIIYSLDTHGLVATLPGRSASSRGSVQGSVFNARDIMSRAGEHATKNAMNALAADTGGFLVENTNDLGAGLRKVLKDTETYYLIAYEPTNARRDGAFRKIEVRLPAQRDIKIRTRKGYFAPDDRKAKAGAPGEPADEARSADERRLAGMKTALTSVVPQEGIPVRMAADFVSVDGAAAQVVVSSHVDLRGVPFVRVGDRHVASVDAAAVVFDESGAVVGKLPAERADLDLTDASYERALKDGLPYQRTSPLKPGRYRVRFAAREDGMGKLGSASQWLQVPNLADGKLALSSLFLLEKEEVKGESAKASAEGGLALRGAQALRRFKNTQSLYVQLFAYNPARDAAGVANLVTQAEIWRAGVRLASAAPEAMEQGAPGTPPVAHTQSIKLAPFAPGDYEVRMVVTDGNANATVSGRVGFTID